jgi:Tol biopolymer transport system component
MRPNGADLTLLSDTVAGYPFGAWSPDGSRVAFLSGSFGEGSILVINADGTRESHVGDIQARPPEWSPDGTRLLFEAVEGGIYSVGADGSGLTEIAKDGHGPKWSPDGMRIAFVSERNGNRDLFLVDPDGSDERRLTHDPAPDEAFSWAPDGHRIVYVSYRHGAEPENIGIGDAEVFVVDPRTGRSRNLSRNAAWDGDPDWSPDGARIVFTRRTDHAEIYVMRADGSRQEMLPGMPGDAVNDCCARWRP